MPNNDLISREAAIRAVHEEFDGCLVWDESGETTANAVESVLYLVQSVDAAPVKHGRWIPGEMQPHATCSVCRHWFSVYHMTNYCPHCGALMRGGDDDA